MVKSSKAYCLNDQSLATLLLKPHAAVLKKLMKLRKCRTRKDVDALEVDQKQLKSLIEGISYQDPSGSQQLLRITDISLANLLQLTANRWHYLKRVLLRDRVISEREKKKQLLLAHAEEAGHPCALVGLKDLEAVRAAWHKAVKLNISRVSRFDFYEVSRSSSH